MALNEVIRAKMVEALKSGDKETKQIYSGILDALNKEAKSLLVETLTTEQEATVIKRMIKQTDESILKCPANRPEFLEKLKFEREIIVMYMPKQMEAEEINSVISEVITELGIDTPTKKDKGKIMKLLMPKVKGKADGRLVNELLEAKMN